MHLPITSPSAIASAYRDGSLVIVPDHADWVARFPAGALLFDGVANSQFSVPILAQGRPIGALGLYFRDERRPTEVDVRLVTSLTEQAAIALERARLVERERAAAERTRQLQAVTAALAKAATERDVGRVLSDHARRVGAIDATVDLRGTRALGAATGWLYVVDEHDDALALIRPDGSSDTQGRVELTAAVPVADVVRTQGSVLLPSADEARQRYPAMFGTGEPVPRGERAWAWLPLRVGSHVVGGMGLSFATERSFDGQERWALET